ncbi:hypothetical protein RJ639_026471 [Escallonia herrerae]|uniref:RING-type domain-containing protein n=1 Tax=Escallonia herrerae TaxID=1293975 RepID=A0AA88S766_9ASTE|nr:hypothetical protein RJ639_026471 [Escallonia herrerae]
MAAINTTTSSTPQCSICLDDVVDNGGRSTAKLQCGHAFHLDCIGSQFNVKGVMQCPNCRATEDGLWMFAAGGFEQSINFEHVEHAAEDAYEMVQKHEFQITGSFCSIGVISLMVTPINDGPDSRCRKSVTILQDSADLHWCMLHGFGGHRLGIASERMDNYGSGGVGADAPMVPGIQQGPDHGQDWHTHVTDMTTDLLQAAPGPQWEANLEYASYVRPFRTQPWTSGYLRPGSIPDIHVHQHSWMTPTHYSQVGNAMSAANQGSNAPGRAARRPLYYAACQGTSPLDHEIARRFGASSSDGQAVGPRGQGASSSNPSHLSGGYGPAIRTIRVVRQQPYSSFPSPALRASMLARARSYPNSADPAPASYPLDLNLSPASSLTDAPSPQEQLQLPLEDATKAVQSEEDGADDPAGYNMDPSFP